MYVFNTNCDATNILRYRKFTSNLGPTIEEYTIPISSTDDSAISGADYDICE